MLHLPFSKPKLNNTFAFVCLSCCNGTWSTDRLIHGYCLTIFAAYAKSKNLMWKCDELSNTKIHVHVMTSVVKNLKLPKQYDKCNLYRRKILTTLLEIFTGISITHYWVPYIPLTGHHICSDRGT